MKTLQKEKRQVGVGPLERTSSNSSTEGSSDGSSNVGCHFTKNFMKESLESVVPRAPPPVIGLCSSAISSGDSLGSSQSDSPVDTPSLSPSGSCSSSDENDRCIPLTPKTSAYGSACTLTSNATLNSRNCLPLFSAMERLNERPEFKRLRKSEVRIGSDFIIHDSLTDGVINITEECMDIEERPPE